MASRRRRLVGAWRQDETEVDIEDVPQRIPLKNLFRRAEKGDSAFLQRQHAVTGGQGAVHIVVDRDDRLPVAAIDLSDDGHDVALVPVVQEGGRFVQQ